MDFSTFSCQLSLEVGAVGNLKTVAKGRDKYEFFFYSTVM